MTQRLHFYIPAKTSDPQLVQDLLKSKAFVLADDKKTPLKVTTMEDVEAYVLDPFHPKVSEFLNLYIDRLATNGFWLDDSQPKIKKALAGSAQIQLPFKSTDAMTELQKGTLPLTSLHAYEGTPTTHFNVHSIYGSALSRSLRSAKQKDFIMSESTFFGDGSKGVFHLLPRS